MKQPDYFDPKSDPNHTKSSNSKKIIATTQDTNPSSPLTNPQNQSKSCCHQPHCKSKGTLPQTPTISQVHQRNNPQKSQQQKNGKNSKKPFQWSFLLPKYWGIWLIFAIFLPLIYLPLKWQFKIGKYFGTAFFYLGKRRQQDTLINLKLAFPEYDDLQRQEMAKMVFIQAGIGIFESLCAWFRPDVFTRQVTVSGLQHLVNAQKQQQTVLILGGHYTMLDLGGLFASMFIPIDIVYRPQNNALLEWFIYNARTKIFNDQIAHEDMRHLVRNIKQKHLIWYTPDQDFGLKQGVMANFFGVPAATLTAQRRLATLTQKKSNPQTADKQPSTAVVMVHFYRQTGIDLVRKQRPHYHLQFSPVLKNYPSDDELADANRINQLLEEFIRIDPTQYMWFHRRFKTQPDGTNYYK